MENPFFPIFEHFLSMTWASKQEKSPGKKTFSSGFEQDFSSVLEGKRGGKSIFSLVFSGIFLFFGRKNHLENPFFPGFEWEKHFFWDISMFWEEKSPGKAVFSPFLGCLEPVPPGFWGGFGNIWSLLSPFPTLGIAPKLDFPKNPHFGMGFFPPLLPLEPGWGRFFFGMGMGGGENPKSLALEQLGAGNEFH